MMKLLLVDDSVDMWILLRDLLADVPGLEIAGEAGDVPEALELVRTLRPDVVILDIHLTGGSGITVLREIKRMRPVPVVIMLTSLGHPAYRPAALEAGADYFFEKTTGLPEMHRTLKELAREAGTVRGGAPTKES
jgi:DNA-binding NarL/FixJ family response regulator